VRYEPDYFGKCGFTSPKSLKQKVNIINVGELDELARKSSTKEEGKLFVDLENLGYTKLLGSGKVTNPLVIKVGAFSKSAEEKIKKVGGQILGEVEQEGE
jgi:large subunit ribosomal protein L15